MTKRYIYLDYIKGIMIMLMVLFHITYFTDQYPMLSAAVYTFHMPIFLLISGFLINIDRDFKKFGKGALRILIPYVLFEMLYIFLLYVFGTVLHANNTIDSFSFSVIYYKLIVHPIGTYWYLHTLFACMVVYYVICKLINLKGISSLLVTAVVLYGITFLVGISWANVIYFLVGAYIARLDRNLINLIPPSFYAGFPLLILFSSVDNFDRATLAGFIITILMISFLLFTYNYFIDTIISIFSYLGRNTLSVVVFSPFFTVLTKVFIPYFEFDITKIVFAIFASLFTLLGCMISAIICEKLHVSRFLFFKEKIYKPYKVN